MAETLLCPQCGKPVPADAPNGSCPVCMTQVGLESEVNEQRTMPPVSAHTQEPATLPPQMRARAGEETLTSPAGGYAADPGSASAATLVSVPGYEILGELGRGGMGVVYKARHLKLNRIVALKMILAGGHAGEADLARFRTEAEAIARLQHRNIVQIYEISEHEGKPYFSLEFCSGGSLAQMITGTPWPVQDAARMVETLARGMHAAHQKGVIHRDLKPANILLSGAEQDARGAPERISSSPRAPDRAALVPKVTDFGLAKKLDEASQTQSGAIMGTPSYMAPEQAGGKGKEVGPAADVYALGAILYELLTGRPPFKAVTAMDTVMQVMLDEPVSLSQLQPKTPKDLETICLKCLQKDPGKRYASAEALADDLERYREGRPITARPLGEFMKFWRLCRRHPGTSTSLALVLVSLLILLVVIVIFNQRLRHELHQNEAMNRELQLALTKQVADRIDSDLRQLSQIPHVMATTLSLRSDWRDDQLEPWMKQMLDMDPRVFGTCVAFEPRQSGGREDFALYAFRGQEAIKAKTLLPPNYMPHYREWSWYSDAKKQQRALWSEPFVDTGGGDIPMITYSVPIMRDGRFAGVVTADLSVAYFDAMRQWLDEVKPGKNGYAFVISKSGTFISHPNPQFQMPRKIADTPAFQDTEALRTLTQRLLNRETGIAQARDPSTGKEAFFFFAPIAAAQWSFVAVSEE
jgi:serine/threonine protein kinase